MAHVISDECVSCGACEAECPVGAISQGADHFEIDADACVDCGACAAQCPTGAISQTCNSFFCQKIVLILAVFVLKNLKISVILDGL